MSAAPRLTPYAAPAPRLPAGVDVNSLFEGIHWHQKWEVFQGVWTPGGNPVADLCSHAGLPHDLRGKRVLDVGAWHGCFSFECERRGASEVVALSLESPQAVGFPKLKEALGSRVEYVQESVYTLDRKTLGEFDVVLFFGVLYHLRYPLLAIDKLRGVCRGKVYAETHVIDHRFPSRGWLGRETHSLKQVSSALTDVPLWRFYKGAELNNDRSNWFGPNIRAVLDAFESAGFTAELSSTWLDRAAVTATVRSDLSSMLDQTYEGIFPHNQQFIGL